MHAEGKIRVGILGAGAWADSAHIPGWNRDPRCEVVVVCDVDKTRIEFQTWRGPEIMFVARIHAGRQSAL